MNKIRLLGETVTVYKYGVIWTPSSGGRFLLGKTREEAEAELLRVKSEKLHLLPAAPLREKRPTESRLARHYKNVFNSARGRAKKFGVGIMSMDEFESIVKRAGGRCELTGIPFSTQRAEGHRKAMWAPSIDRIDNHKGYEFSNCRLVCLAVNLAMNEFGFDMLLRISRALLGDEDAQRRTHVAS